MDDETVEDIAPDDNSARVVEPMTSAAEWGKNKSCFGNENFHLRTNLCDTSAFSYNFEIYNGSSNCRDKSSLAKLI